MEITTELQQFSSDYMDGSYGRGTSPFEQEMVSITKQDYIKLTSQISYWKAQHNIAKEKIAKLAQKLHFREGQIKDLRNRLFGK